MCSRRLKQAPFGQTYGPKIRYIDPLDGCACMITSRMLNALRIYVYMNSEDICCLYTQEEYRDGNIMDGCAYMFKGCDKLNTITFTRNLIKERCESARSFSL